MTTNVTHEYVENSMGETDDLAPKRVLLVINQKEARIFHHDDKESKAEHLHPEDNGDEFRYLKHTIGADASSKANENMAYFKSVAIALKGTEDILIMGNGSGSSASMTHFKNYLDTHDKEIAARVVGTLTVDVESFTEGELLKQSRNYFLHHAKLS